MTAPWPWQMPDGYGLTDVKARHGDILWETLQLRLQEPDANISHRVLPRREDHDLFVLNHPFRYWYLVVDLASVQEYIAEVRVGLDNSLGIFVWPERRLEGHARRLLQGITKMLEPLPAIPAVRPGHWVANINPGNDASIRLFGALGFRLVQHTYALEAP